MCTPHTYLPTATSNMLSGVLKGVGVVSNVASTIEDVRSNKANSAYQTQVALNNAKIAQNEAMRQRQIGIEKSRLEKIAGLQEISQLQAKNSASNLDMMSKTNQLAYQDVFNLSNNKASAVQKEYNTNANSYFSQANNYYNQANSYKNKYNQSLFGYATNALGKYSQVAYDWYMDKEDVLS